MKNVKPCSSQTCSCYPTWLAHLTPAAAVVSTILHNFAQLIKGRDSPGKAPVVVCETAPRVNGALPFVPPVLTRMMHFGNPTQVSRRAHTNQLLSVLFTLTS
jgi:hypothetical protein